MWIAIQNAVGARQGVGGGPPPPPPYTPPLDSFTGATAAYSVRKLSSTYSGPCIEAYRVSDGATQDIGFDSAGLIDTAAIATFGGASEVRTRTWYDQSGNALDAVQTTASQMPQIYDGSAVNTENDTPAILWDDTNQTYLQTGLYDAWSDGSSFTTMVFNGRRGPAGSQTYWDIETGVQRYSSGAGNIFALFYGTSQVSVATNVAPTTQGIHTWYNVASETDAAVYIDGALKGTNTRTNPVGDTNVSAYIGSRVGGSQWNSCHYQEIIHWGSDVASTRTGLESNLNDYYQIANLPASNSGLLYDYPDAAAAYSVRQLSNNAIKCMRVRRDAPPYDEQDIGFTDAGDLDEQAIATFGGSDPLTVSRWYDQSGQSNHAVQNTPGAQPQIYNGTAVITENGKPAIKFSYETNPTLSRLNYTSIPATRFYHVWVMNQPTSQRLNWMNAGSGSYYRLETSGQMYLIKPNDFDSAFGDIGKTGYKLRSIDRDSDATATAYVDGSSSNAWTGLDPSAFTFSNVDASFVVSGAGYHVNIQEFIIYDASQSTNRTGIEYNVGEYYGIGVLLLDTYTTASAGYSLRKLRTDYTGSAVRVRRDVAPYDEQDIGFDSYGNLDIAALDAFSAGDPLRVSIWYDQSTGGWDASNPAYNKQPLIHDGTSVVTLNGSPAMDYEEDATSRSLNTANGVISATASPLWIFVVGGINAGFTTSYPKITGPSVPMGVVGTTTNFFSVWRGTQVFWGPGNGAPAGDQYIRTETATGTLMDGYLNGVILANNKTIGTSNFATNLQFGGGGGYAHKIQEYIIFEDNMSADRVSIENTINSHYGTY